MMMDYRKILWVLLLGSFGLTACAPKKVGADTNVWSVTAQNGDTMTGCLAEDVTPNILGYIDLEALPNFDIATFKDLRVTVEDHYESGGTAIISGLANMSRTHPPIGRSTLEDKIKHCAAYPQPVGATEWYFTQHTGELAISYRLFSLEEKMVFVDVRTRFDPVSQGKGKDWKRKVID